jgi:hypothetical protein
MKKSKSPFYYLILLAIILGIIGIIINYSMFSNNGNIENLMKMFSGNGNIENLTDQWINAVTINNDPTEVANMFCSDGSLVGTVSREIRTRDDIKRYFDFFAKLPEIEVISKKYNISKVTSNVYLNTAFITWKWQGLDEPIVARMTFIFRDNCIFQLHSSSLPELNKDLLNISGSA